ncbi:unnamed protein product [Cutaneotrichosporon oleaginosum]
MSVFGLPRSRRDRETSQEAAAPLLCISPTRLLSPRSPRPPWIIGPLKRSSSPLQAHCCALEHVHPLPLSVSLSLSLFISSSAASSSSSTFTSTTSLSSLHLLSTTLSLSILHPPHPNPNPSTLNARAYLGSLEPQLDLIPLLPTLQSSILPALLPLRLLLILSSHILLLLIITPLTPRPIAHPQINLPTTFIHPSVRNPPPIPPQRVPHPPPIHHPSTLPSLPQHTISL